MGTKWNRANLGTDLSFTAIPAIPAFPAMTAFLWFPAFSEVFIGGRYVQPLDAKGSAKSPRA
jgi:hypothetical protein